jgi:hypothetical protein
MHVGKKGMGLHELVLSVLTCEGLVDETLDIAPLRKKVLRNSVYNVVTHPIHPLYSYLISKASQWSQLLDRCLSFLANHPNLARDAPHSGIQRRCRHNARSSRPPSQHSTTLS